MRSSLDGGSKLGRIPHPGLAQRRRHAVGQHHRRPVRGAGDAAERQRVVGIALASDLAAGQLDVVGHDVELLCRDALELLGQLPRRHMRRDGGARREAARVGAGGDRPLVLRGVHLERHVDVAGLQSQLVGDDLRQHRLVALALHGDVGGDRNRAERIDVDGHHRGRAVLRAGLLARLRCQQGREITHVRHGGLDHDGEADAVFPAGLARLVAALLADIRAGRRRSRSPPRADSRPSYKARRPRRDTEIYRPAPDCAGSRRDDRARARPRCAAPAAPAPDKAADRRSRE